MTSGPDLAQWLLQQIDADEAAAGNPWPHVYSAVQTWWDDGEDEPGFFAADQPDDVKGLAKTLSQILRSTGTYARVLAECDAKRRVVEFYRAVPQGMQEHYRAGLGRAVRCLALPYADRPGYRQEWAP